MSFLEDFQANLASLPAMLHRSYATMRDLDKSVHALQRQNEQRCEKEISDIKRGFESGNVTPDTSLVRFSDEVLEEQKHCVRIADEKVALATQAYDLVDSQIQQLDQYLRTIDELRQEKELAAAAAGGGGANNIIPGSNTRSGRGSGSKAGRKKAQVPTESPSVNIDLPVDPNEPTYCFCNQVSFGEMVACDNPDCKIEWFHFGCVGIKEQPKGKWYCSNCAGLQKRRKGK